jgi:hypothetical protein
MARLGRRAQKALDALEGEGEYREGIAWLEICERWAGDGLESLRVETAPGIFAYQGVTRDNLPGWKDLRLEFGPLDQDVLPSKQVFRFFPVYLVGKGLMFHHPNDNGGEDDEKGEVLETTLSPPTAPKPFPPKVKKRRGKRRRFRRHPTEIGQARLKSSNGITFSPESAPNSGDDTVIRIYKDITSSDNAMEAANRFGQLVAAHLIRTTTYFFEMEDIPQWLLDLQREVPGWLIEDGYIQNWFDQILLWAKNLKIVSEVMES